MARSDGGVCQSLWDGSGSFRQFWASQKNPNGRTWTATLLFMALLPSSLTCPRNHAEAEALRDPS